MKNERDSGLLSEIRGQNGHGTTLNARGPHSNREPCATDWLQQWRGGEGLGGISGEGRRQRGAQGRNAAPGSGDKQGCQTKLLKEIT